MLIFESSRKYAVDNISMVSQTFVKYVSFDSLSLYWAFLHKSSEEIRGTSKKRTDVCAGSSKTLTTLEKTDCKHFGGLLSKN